MTMCGGGGSYILRGAAARVPADAFAYGIRRWPQLPLRLTRGCSTETPPPSVTAPLPPPPLTPDLLPPELTGSVPPIRPAIDRKLPRHITKLHVNAHMLQHDTSFLGFSSRRTHPSAYNYLLGSAGGQAIIDPEQTLIAIRRVLHILKKVSFRGGKTLFVSTQPTLARLCRVVGEQTDQFYLTKRWVPGMLTNWAKSREHIHAKLRPDPLLQAAGRLKYSDLQKANYYRGVEHMTRPPDLIVRLDSTPLYGEPAKLNVPLISVVDSDMSSVDVDYPIPANTKSLRFYHTLAHLLVRTCNEGTALRAQLDQYSVVEDLEPQVRGGGGGGGRGGRGGGAPRGAGGRRGGASDSTKPFRAPDRSGRGGS